MSKNKFLLNGLSIGVITLVLLFSTFFVSYAAEGSGNGNGGGGGGNNDTVDPVTLVGSYLTTITDNISTTGESIKDSSTVGTIPTIKLVFNKNVVSSTVWDSNSQAFILADTDGNSIPINVYRIPEEGANSNPDEKRHIFVTPEQPLTAGSVYTLTIKANLTANNTTALGKKETISFTVNTDVVSPELTISTPKTSSISTKKKVTISGSTEAGSIVKINSTVVPVNEEGLFSYEITLNSGVNQITITSTDEAGNIATSVLTVTYDSSASDGGSGNDDPLALLSSSIQNGTTGVSLKPEIKLTFSKNIVSSGVSEHNQQCFSLLSANGTLIPIDIIFADDLIDPDKRNDAIIIPKNPLDIATTYTLVVSSDLKSKSGVTTGQETKITFTTEAKIESPAQNLAGNETADKDSELEQQPIDVGNKLPNTGTDHYNTILLGLLFVAFGGILFFYIKRKKIA